MKTVLVVDDEFGIAESLRDILQDEGYRVVLAQDGKEGLAEASQLRPELILVDYMMPALDGVKMCAAIQSAAETQHIPIVMMSAIEHSRIPPGCKAAAFLHKPFDIADLLAVVKKLAGAP